MGVVIDLVTRLPIAIWFLENPRASDTRFEDNLLDLASPQTLLLIDRGFYHFQFWQTLIERKVHFITRIKINAAIEDQQVFTDGYGLRDRLIKIGSGTKKTPFITLRLIEVRVGKTWRSYLTSVLEPEVLPPYVVIDLYQKRWRIEDAFNILDFGQNNRELASIHREQTSRKRDKRNEKIDPSFPKLISIDS